MRSWKPVCSNISTTRNHNRQGPFKCNLTEFHVWMAAMWAMTYERSRLSSCLYPSSAKRFSPESIACASVTLADPTAMSSPNPEALQNGEELACHQQSNSVISKSFCESSETHLPLHLWFLQFNIGRTFQRWRVCRPLIIAARLHAVFVALSMSPNQVLVCKHLANR